MPGQFVSAMKTLGLLWCNTDRERTKIVKNLLCAD
jgi:hypothetical protein